MPIIDSLFGQRLSQLLKENDIKQNEFAEYMGVSESTVGKWILGKAEPSLIKIAKIAERFNTSPEWLIGYERPHLPFEKGVKVTELFTHTSHDKSMVEAYHKASKKDKFTVDMVLNEYTEHDLIKLAEEEANGEE